MFPYVQRQERFLSFRQRIVLVGSGKNFQMSVMVHKPCPAASELGYSGSCKFFLEFFKGAEVFLDFFSHRAGKGSASFRCHHVPEEGMVEIAAAIVSYGAPDIFRKKVQMGDEIADGLICQLRMRFQGLIQVGRVGGMVLVMVEMKGSFIHHRFKGIVGIR